MIDWILLWILKLFPIVQMPNSASWQKCYLSKSLTWKVSYLSFSSILLTSLILRKPNISSFLFFNEHLFWWSIKPQFLLSIVRCSQCSLCNLWLKFGFRLMFYHCTVNSQKYHILNFLVYKAFPVSSFNQRYCVAWMTLLDVHNKHRICVARQLCTHQFSG